MSEPSFIRQTGEVEQFTQQAFEWFREAAEEAKKEGCTFFRYSYHCSPPLLLIEGWLARPDDQGPMRFMLQAES